MTTNLKVLIAAVGLAALATSPVLARTHVHSSAPAAQEGRAGGGDQAVQFEIHRDAPTYSGSNTF
jgi:hypothetical protein